MMTGGEMGDDDCLLSSGFREVEGGQRGRSGVFSTGRGLLVPDFVVEVLHMVYRERRRCELRSIGRLWGQSHRHETAMSSRSN